MTDLNVWISAEMRLDGYKYYEILLVNVDNIIIIYHVGDKVAK